MPSAGAATSVSGTVYVDAALSDQPLAGATVVVASGDQSWTATTSPRGVYSISVTAGEHTITASKDGYISKSWDVEVDSNVTVNFSLASE